MEKAPKLKKLKEKYTSPKMETEEGRSYDPRPVIEISEDALPEIKKWNIDENYKLMVEVDMIGIEEKDYGAYKGKKVARLRVIKIGSK